MPIRDEQLQRPIERDGEDWKKIEKFLTQSFRDAVEARRNSIEDDYSRGLKNYAAIPAEQQRILPWVGASNLVVPIIQIFLDTMVARTLNIIFATRPLVISTLPNAAEKKALETYLEHKAIQAWNYYDLTKDILNRGLLTGTCAIKTISYERKVTGVAFGGGGEFTAAPTTAEYLLASGPKSKCIPFEDVFYTPLSANSIEELDLIIHRIPYTEYQVERQLRAMELGGEKIESLLRVESDAVKLERSTDYGSVDSRTRWVHVIEVKFSWILGDAEYLLIGKFLEENEKLLDVYIYPYPGDQNIYDIYRPFPKIDSIYGDSLPRRLEMLQEEASEIHNDRRNNAKIANAPVFKKRSGAMIPNPSTSWYPGKVWELDSLDDLDMILVGRNYDPMIQDETLNLQYAERITALSPPMQGMAQGGQDKRGVYNASGTLALLAEGNQRQDSNIRDARYVLSEIAKKAFLFQVLFDPADEDIDLIGLEHQPAVRKIFSMPYAQLSRTAMLNRTSSASANREIEKRNLLDSVGVLVQYSKEIQNYAVLLANPQMQQPGNPMREIIIQVLRMHKWLASRILNSFDIQDIDNILPDVLKAFQIDQDTSEVMMSLQQTAQMPIPGGGGPGGIPGGFPI